MSDTVTDFKAAAERLRTATAEDPRPPEYSDDALALRFTDRMAAELRYVARWSQWLRWGGCAWAEDQTLSVFDEARATARDAAAECKKAKAAAAIKAAKTVSAIERLARCDRRHAATVDQWDNGPHAINARNPAQ